MIYKNTPRLKQFLEDAGFHKLARQSEFDISETEHRKHLLAAHLSPKAHHADISAFCCLTADQQPDSIHKPEFGSLPPELPIGNTSPCDLSVIQHTLTRVLRMETFIAVLLFLILLFLLTGTAHAQNANENIIVPSCGTVPTNYGSTGRAPSTVDPNGNKCNISGVGPINSQTWTTGTALNTAATVNMAGYEAAYIQVNAGVNLTAGALTFEVSDVGSGTWTTVLLTRSNSTTTETSYTLVSNTTQAWFVSLSAPQFRVRLSTQITTSAGNGSTTLTITPVAFPLSGTSGGGGGGGGTSSSFGSAFPGTGTAIGAKNGANMVNLAADNSNNLNVNCQTGCATAGDTVGSTITLNSASGANSHADVSTSGQRGVLVVFSAATADLLTVVAKTSSDGGATFQAAEFADPTTGNPIASIANPQNGAYQILFPGAITNAQVLVSSYTSGSVAATLRATTINPAVLIYGFDAAGGRLQEIRLDGLGQVVTDLSLIGGNTVAQVAAGIQKVGVADQNGNAGTSNSTTFSGKVAFDQNLLGTLGTAFSTAGKVDIKGADGDVLVRSNAASTFPVNANQQGTWTNRIVGNTGAALDAAGQNATSPANEVLTGCQFNTSPTGITSGNVSPLQCDTNGNVLVNIKGGVVTGYAQASPTATQLGPLNQAAVTTNPPSYTTGQTDPLSLTPSGGLRGDITSVGGSAFALGQQSVANSLPIIGPAITYNAVPPTLTNGQTEQDIQISTRGAVNVNPGPETFNVTVNTALPQGANTIGAVTQASGPWTVNHTQTAGITLGATAVTTFGSTPAAANVDAVNSSVFAGTTPLTATGNSLNVACTSGCAGSAPSDTVGTAQVLGALNNTASVSLAGELGVLAVLTINTSATFTIVAEVSPDAGTNWLPAVFFDPVTGAMSTSIVNPTAPTYFQIGYIGSATQARVRVSAFTSGSITAQLRATTTRPYVMNYGSDGTNLRPITTTTGGLTKVDISGTGANGTAIKVDNSGVTQPVSGTVTANQGTAAGLGSAWPIKLTDGTNTAPTMDAVSRPGFQKITDGTNTMPTMDAAARAGFVQGSLSNNGAAAGTNRMATLPGIAQTSYNNGTASTQGRDVAPNVGTDGLLWTASLPAMRPASYTASKNFAASSTTDNACLPGNASNTVLLTEIHVSGTQTTAGIVNVEIAKRSTAGSGGTSANMTVVPDDSNYAAGVSVPVSYTGTGPTVGTLVGDVDDVYVGFMAAGTASPNDIYIGNFRQKPIVLRGTAEKACVNLGGALTGGNMSVAFKWIETTTITP